MRIPSDEPGAKAKVKASVERLVEMLNALNISIAGTPAAFTVEYLYWYWFQPRVLLVVGSIKYEVLLLSFTQASVLVKCMSPYSAKYFRLVEWATPEERIFDWLQPALTVTMASVERSYRVYLEGK
ncbi:MAG: hypothetical protein IPK79_00570 [Vampirovibrionales bacterium]|nr:hypothetical protein [Vampirovibrionales bacterium]